jgi:hypothetical protein
MAPRKRPRRAEGKEEEAAPEPSPPLTAAAAEAAVAAGAEDPRWKKAESDRYSSDPSYRLACGPDVERWLWNQEQNQEHDESLIGLELCLDFGVLGECTGKVTSSAGDKMLRVAWTCAPNHDETFESELPADAVIAWYFRGRAAPIPSWAVDAAEPRAVGCPLFNASAGTKLVNFALPLDANEYFPWVDDERNNRWWATLCRLNDPPAAEAYAPGMASYPLPLLLTIILVTKEEFGDPDVQLPTVVVEGKAEVYALADSFARRLSGSSERRMGYGELKALEKLIGTVAATVPPASATSDDERWRRAYTNVEALVLTLSEQFEEVDDNWQYADDPERVESVCASVILTIGAVLLHAPSVATRRELSDNWAEISRHMKAGSFVSGIRDDDFKTKFPDACRAWELLISAEFAPAPAAGGGGGGGCEGSAGPPPGKKALLAQLKKHKGTVHS